MFVLSEWSPQLEPSASADDIRAATEVAQLASLRIINIPPDFSLCETAGNALWQLPFCESPTPAIWIGYIPTLERYSSIYKAAKAKNVFLLNTPTQHQIAQEFDFAYSHLQELTPRSFIISHLEECETAAHQLGFPIFVKGAVQSRKARGWKACVANNIDELRELADYLFSLEARTRGRVVLLNNRVLGWGYYWEGNDPLKELSTQEQEKMLSVAQEASRRLQVPFVAIDVGQTETGHWIVIESGDAQFAGTSQISRLQLWNNLREALVNGG